MAALVAVAAAQYHHQQDAHHAPAQYKFAYGVHDDHTGDIKSQQEERHGDKVVGQYTLVDADGYRRVVNYSSDKHTGFLVHVHREPLKGYRVAAVPKKIVKLVKPVVAVAPVVHHVQPLVHHVQPVVHHIQPVHHVQQYRHEPVYHRVTLPQQVHHVQVKPVVAAYAHHKAHSQTSFKSGKVSYQY